MRERIIERRAKAKFEKLHWICLKFTPQGSSGWPDRIIITENGDVAWAEFKAPGKDLEPLQKIRQRELRSRGILCEKIDDETSLNLFIDALQRRS